MLMSLGGIYLESSPFCLFRGWGGGFITIEEIIQWLYSRAYLSGLPSLSADSPQPEAFCITFSSNLLTFLVTHIVPSWSKYFMHKYRVYKGHPSN